jgi:equilibrative nucleoside transporter 1/2/3
MFLAASPYFQRRFAASPFLLTHFPSFILSISTVTNLVTMILLTSRQRQASYPQRITLSLFLNIGTFVLLTISTVSFRSVAPEAYFAFLMIIVFTASLAAGLCQNGVFAYVSGFGDGKYTQGIMTGQAVAGVLPCMAQIFSVLSVPEPKQGAAQETSESAFIYFMTSVGVSVLALGAFLISLRRRHGQVKTIVRGVDGAEAEEQLERKEIGMWTLYKKLKWLTLAVVVCFAITMVYPVFTQQIISVRPIGETSRLFQPACFIPLAFLLWNAGDLAGRLCTLVPALSATHRPRLLFAFAILRAGFVPLYLLCNMRGHGAVIASDAFYLLVVQFGFGITNGYLGTECMMGATEWVDETEREAAGGFMSLMLVAGLSVGSLLSFLAA